MKKFATVILVCLAGAASAQDFPALYDVTGIADNDELKMRTRPTELGTVIGSLAHDTTGIEVIEEEKGWGRINSAGLSGWVSLEMMDRQEGTQMPEGERFKCFGTEPVWSATVTQGDGLLFTRPEDNDKAFSVETLSTTVTREHPHALLGSKLGENVALVMTHEMCTDGISQYRYGFSGNIVIGGYDTQVYSGCCSLDMD